MAVNAGAPDTVEDLIAAPVLAEALHDESFRHFLDHLLIAVAVSECDRGDAIVYANSAFEELAGLSCEALKGQGWGVFDAAVSAVSNELPASNFILAPEELPLDCIVLKTGKHVALYASLIESEDGHAQFRVVAMVERSENEADDRAALLQEIAERDMKLREIQHRVKNNLQMIASLIRIEAKNSGDVVGQEPFSRLAGRIDSLHLLYQALEAGEGRETVDLGLYLGDIATAVMRSHGVEGVRLNMNLDTFPASINVAMPAGLVVNELFTNALKYAFKGRDGGAITLTSVVEDGYCTVIVADDGVGLPEGVEWPARGKLGNLIVKSLRENAGARIEVASQPGEGMKVTMRFPAGRAI